eukprot:14598718-Ditylum_brightwellii.AAC.1
MKKKSQYNTIIGRDVLQQYNIDILNSKLTFAWDGIKIPMVPKDYWDKESVDTALKSVFWDKSVKLQAEEQLKYLGFTILRNGIKPQKKKIEAILRTVPPNNQKQGRQFLGMINYYKDMWKERACILAPLSELTGKKKK